MRDFVFKVNLVAGSASILHEKSFLRSSGHPNVVEIGLANQNNVATANEAMITDVRFLFGID
jgi:hypothetical protein